MPNTNHSKLVDEHIRLPKEMIERRDKLLESRGILNAKGAKSNLHREAMERFLKEEGF